jgi:Plavaka transposase
LCDPLKIAEGQLSNKDFASEMDYSPKQVFSEGGRRQYSNFMSGNWAWQQAVRSIDLIPLFALLIE